MGLASFFLLSCAITWLCAAPLVWAWTQQTEPPAYAVSLAGLSAFGPTLAAIAVASVQRNLRSVFRPWRTAWTWVLLAFFTPMLLAMLARAIEMALGGTVPGWWQPPSSPEMVAALVVFSVGEELGWRGYAHPRMVARFGPIAGSLLLGSVWAVWHVAYLVSPDTGRVDAVLAMMMLSLPFYAIIYAWFLERANGSLAVALALHAGGHFDNTHRIPDEHLRLKSLVLIVIIAAGILAAWSLRRSARQAAVP